MVKIPKIKVCKLSPFRKTCFVTSLMKQCHVLFEITFSAFFSLSHICSLLFRITDWSKPVWIAFYKKICIFNLVALVLFLVQHFFYLRNFNLYFYSNSFVIFLQKKVCWRYCFWFTVRWGKKMMKVLSLIFFEAL